LRISVKAVQNGFSQFANSKLKAGDVLEVGTPEGSLRSLPIFQITPLYLEAESLLFFLF
jgi:ferredoxin-NADP reductase